MSVRLRLLGGFDAEPAGRPAPRRVVRALLTALALAPRREWSRDQLVALLWGDQPDRQGRASLRQAMAECRRWLGAEAVQSDRDRVWLDRSQVEVDVDAFLAEADKGAHAAAVGLYRGDLLEGVPIPGGAFEEWHRVEQTRLRDTALTMLSRLLEVQTGTASAASARRILEIDPYSEPAVAALIRHHLATGERSVALRHFREFSERLMRDLGVEPGPETKSLLAEPMQQAVATAPVMGGSVGSRTRSRLRPLALAGAFVLALAAAAFFSGPPDQGSRKPLVAVLPFEALDQDRRTVLFARGLTQDVITDLARFPEFEVLAAESTSGAVPSEGDPAAFARGLAADYVVTGSIQRQGERLRVLGQLRDASTGQTLWTDRWDRPDDDLFAIQAEISERVSNQLGGGDGVVQQSGRLAAHRKAPASLTAYELYLLGTEHLEKVTESEVKLAIELLDQAVALDPGFARAWVELHHSHSVMTGFGYHEPHFRKSIEAAERALQLDPSDPEAQAVYAISRGLTGDFDAAKASFQTALHLAPNQFEILVFYISWASTFGEPEKGADLVDRAIRLNPRFPSWAARPFAYAYFMAGRYEQALGMLELLGDDSLGTWLWPYRAGALAALGRMEEAKVAVDEAMRRYPDLSVERNFNEPGFSDAERARVVETMTLAGFPRCASAEVLAAFDRPVRLEGCGLDTD